MGSQSNRASSSPLLATPANLLLYVTGPINFQTTNLPNGVLGGVLKYPIKAPVTLTVNFFFENSILYYWFNYMLHYSCTTISTQVFLCLLPHTSTLHIKC